MKIRIEYSDNMGGKKHLNMKPEDVVKLTTGKSKKEIKEKINNACKLYAGSYKVRGLLNGKVVCSYNQRKRTK